MLSTKLMNKPGRRRAIKKVHIIYCVFTAVVGITLGVVVSSHGKYLRSSDFPCQHCCSLILTVEVNNGVKKEVSSKDVARIWANEEIKMRSFSPVNVRFLFNFFKSSGQCAQFVLGLFPD